MAQKIIVDSTPDLLQPTLYFHQGDIGRQFQIEIATRDGYSVPSGAAAKIQATKPSGLGFSITGTVSGNVVSFASTSGMTDEAGRFPAQIEISSGSDVIYTANFPMVCQDNTHPASTTDGSQEEIVSEITLLVERAESAAATAGADAAVAAQAQVDEMMNYLPTEVSNLKSDLDTIGGQPNYEPNWTVGGYIKDSDGTVAESSGWKYTDFIEVKSNTLLVTFDGNQGNQYNAKYDANKNFIQNLWINGGYDKTPITLADDVKYIRMSCATNRTLEVDYPKISVIDVNEKADNATEKADTNSIDIEQLNGYPFEYPITWNDNGYINNSNGELISYNGWHYTDYIELVDTRPIYVSTDKPQDNNYNAFYDADKNFIRNLYITASSDKALIDYVPTNAKYLRLSCETHRTIKVYPTITAVTQLEERVKALESGESYPLPSYYDDYMVTKNASVNTKMDAIDNCVSFMFFTDPHMSDNEKHSGAMMANIRRNTSVKDVICGGDVISGYGNEASMVADCETYKQYWGGLAPYFVRGNHDIYAKITENTNVGYIEPNSMVINRFMRPLHDDMVIAEGKTYYYVDKPNNKMRFIFVDTNENISGAVVDNVWNPTYSISQTQIDWFIDLLQNTPSGYKIVLFNHIPITSQLAWGSGFAYIFGDIVEAFNAKTSINKTDSYGISAVANFANANGEIILSICGHGHTDDVYTSSSGCVYYEVNCDCTLNNGGSQYTRTAGTTSEQAFDVIIINADNGDIKSVRYGAGIDKTLIQH